MHCEPAANTDKALALGSSGVEALDKACDAPEDAAVNGGRFKGVSRLAAGVRENAPYRHKRAARLISGAVILVGP